MSEIPATIGPYTILETLGYGGMGTVYLGRHTETDRIAAVKVLSATMAREPGLVERFRREVASLEVLANPHIVQYYDSGEHEGSYFFAMEYIDGETLTARLRRERRLEWEEVIEIAVQVCDGLKSAHNEGIIHRDLKPGNLMLTEEGMVKLTDFGVAQIFAAAKLTATGGIVGTAEYMSPEQAQGRRAHRTSDLYSLGGVMYYMLTGRPPFRGSSTVETMQLHRFGQFDSPRAIVPVIPRWLDEVVCRLLEKKPEDRYPDAYVLMLRLQEIPRKVELARGSATVAEDSGSDAETAVAGDSDAGSVGPGEATLMKHMMQIEIERSQPTSLLGRWFNSTTGLIATLAATIALAVFLWQRGPGLERSPRQRFEAGVQLLTGDDPDWRAARRILDTLVAEDPATWRKKAEPYLGQIETLELESWPQSRRWLKNPGNEIERFVTLAREYERLGDRGRAVRILRSVVVLGGDDEQFAAQTRVARRLLASWQRAEPSDGPLPLAVSAAARAARTSRAGRADEARRLWTSILELYADDPRAADEVARARRGLAGTPEPDDPPAETTGP